MKRKIELTEVPIACTLDRSAFEGRMNEFDALFRDALIDRERTVEGIRFRFANHDGVETRIRGLAARELECCSFFAFAIFTHGDEVWWETSVGDRDAQPVLDEFFTLPERLAEARS
jgi:hypothetical protein